MRYNKYALIHFSYNITSITFLHYYITFPTCFVSCHRSVASTSIVFPNGIQQGDPGVKGDGRVQDDPGLEAIQELEALIFEYLVLYYI